MGNPSRRHERRGADRPTVGDRRPCTACAGGTIEFIERYRLTAAPRRAQEPIPAWVCDQCPFVSFVRAPHRAAAARESRARANHRLMQARFRQRPANPALPNSAHHKKTGR